MLNRWDLGYVTKRHKIGRVVIPKEIRRTMRIREGDPLEIFTDREGEVIFKKYSPIGEMNSFAQQYAETLHKTCGLCVIITDRDGVIASAGVPKKEYFEKRLSADLDKLTENRSSYRYKSGDRRLAVIDGDVIGSVVCASSDGEATIDGDVEFRLIQTAAAFLARQLQ